jgi:aspartate kinase
MKTLVMKFGGASVASPESFARVSQIIACRLRQFSRIVVVVSAMGDTTNQLINLASKVHSHPPKRELDMLVSVGERISISLLAMSLMQKNIEAISFTGSQSGVITSDDHSEAKIINIKPARILSELEKSKVVIVAGFQGVSQSGEITTLGRGGSDTSAVALAIALQAEKVEFYKDVKGVYSDDPKLNPSAELFSYLSYDSALEIMNQGARILHSRAVLLAKKNTLPLHILSFHDFTESCNVGTKIGVLSERSLEICPQYEG